MVHIFSVLNKYFALDVESGSLFMLDKLAFLLLLKRISPNSSKLKALSGYSDEEISEAQGELSQLIENGTLFSDTNQANALKSNDISSIDGTSLDSASNQSALSLSAQAKKQRFKRADVKAMCLNVCYACNLECKYCFAKGEVVKSEIMSLETAKKAIDFMIAHSGQNKRLEVDFFGGEPLINYDTVKKTVEYARGLEGEIGKRFKFTMTTNASLLDDEKIAWLNSEMDNIVLSIDGRKDVHNYARRARDGSESYEKIIANCQKLVRSREGEYYVRGTYTRQNLDFSKDVELLSQLGFDQISLEPVVLEDEHMLSLNKTHMPKIKNSYKKLARYYLKSRKKKKTWFNFFHFMLNLDSSPCLKKLVSACGAANEYISVSPDGKIYPCHQFTGNQDFLLGDVFGGFISSSVPKKMASTNILTKTACKKCWAKYYCGGGCASNNYKLGGGLNKVYKTACNITKARLEYALAAAAIERQG